MSGWTICENHRDNYILDSDSMKNSFDVMPPVSRYADVNAWTEVGEVPMIRIESAEKRRRLWNTLTVEDPDLTDDLAKGEIPD